MKKLLFILFIFIISPSIFAKNIVLLSSLPDKDKRATVEIKRQFFKKLYNVAENGNELIYIDKATVHHLDKYLNDPNTMALFWVSHGGYARAPKKRGTGIGATSVLVDFQKINVAKMFQKVHPNIKFLGILGCNSKQIVGEHLNQRADLGIYMPSYSIVATWSFRVALKKFKRHFWKNKYNYLDKDQTYKGYQFEITRKVEKDSRALMVFAGKKLIGILDPLKANEIQTKEFFIPHYQNIKTYDFKIILKSGLLTKNTDDFGSISINHYGENFWKLFAKSDGTAFGVNERIYLFKSKIENLEMDLGIISYQK